MSEAKHYVELRESLLGKFSKSPTFMPNQSMFDLVRDNVVDDNYYAWYMRYVQMACHVLEVDLSDACLGAQLVDEDSLIFIVSSGRDDGKEVHYTGTVVGHQIVLAFKQVPEIQVGQNEYTKNDGADTV